MQWTDDGIVLGVRRHGESSVILELMTREHGRHLGLVRGGKTKMLQPVLQPGNGIRVAWHARLDEHLGIYQVEGTELRAARLMDSPLALYGLASLAHHIRALPERDPHPELYETFAVLVDHLHDPDVAPILFVQFEMALLTDLGFGLDLTACAATGRRDDLAYVSPKSGRAVSLQAGDPYKDRLLRLPGFLLGRMIENRPDADDLRAGFALTEFFLHRNVFAESGRAQPEERSRFVALACAKNE